MEKILQKIIEKIDKGEEISPFLFISKNTEVLNENIKNLALQILKHYNIPKPYLFIFEKNKKNIGIDEMRAFLENSYLSVPFKLQIFLIPNISDFTISTGNNLLKTLEEPGKQNLFFLTNSSESKILETILSRVQVIDFLGSEKNKKNDFFQDLIKKYLKKENFDLINYFFKNKIEKDECVIFLENLIIFAKENLVFIEFLDEILEDIESIQQNNVNAKYIVDKWILKI